MEKKKNGVIKKLVSLWWILLGPTLVFAGTGMYIAGRKVRNKKWKKYGIIYNVSIIGSMILADTIGNDNFYGIGAVLWIVFMVHSIKIIKEYLIRCEMLSEVDYKISKEENLREKIRREYDLNNNMDELINKREEKTYHDNKIYEETLARENPEHMSKEVFYKEPDKDEEPTNEFFKDTLSEQEGIKQANIRVDINHALEEDIAKLPSIGVIRAKKIVEIRNAKGAFKDLNDLILKTELKPHIVEKIKDNICFKVSEESNVNRTHSNRARRMVDM